MATFVSDTFTEASDTNLTSHTGEVGATWTNDSENTATPVVMASTDRVRGSSASLICVNIASGSPASADYDVQADLVVITATNHGGITGRVDDAAGDNYLWRHFNGTGWQMYKRVADVYTQLGSTATPTAISGTNAVKLQMRGTAIEGFADGTSKVEVTDSAVTAAGKAGLRFRSTSTTGYHFDNFTALDPVGQSGPLVGGKLVNHSVLQGRLVGA